MANIIRISNRDKTASPPQRVGKTVTNLSAIKKGSTPPGIQNAVKVRGGR